jgi:hypothetical protein
MNLFCQSCGRFREHTSNGKQEMPGTEWHGMEFWTCDRCHTTRTNRQHPAVAAYERKKRDGALLRINNLILEKQSV